MVDQGLGKSTTRDVELHHKQQTSGQTTKNKTIKQNTNIKPTNMGINLKRKERKKRKCPSEKSQLKHTLSAGNRKHSHTSQLSLWHTRVYIFTSLVCFLSVVCCLLFILPDLFTFTFTLLSKLFTNTFQFSEVSSVCLAHADVFFDTVKAPQPFQSKTKLNQLFCDHYN